MMMLERWRTAAAVAALILMPTLASARTYPLAPGQEMIGQIGEYVTVYKDTLLDVGRENDLGYAQLMLANPGVNPWIPGKDKHIVLPNLYLLPDGPRKGIVLNLAEQRVFYFPPGGKTVETYPIGAGVQGRNTPLGVTRIVSKQVHPGWAPPPSIRAERPELPAYVPPGPDNPMGDLAMGLTWRGYYLHGTNKPLGVGRNVSHGCIHFYPEDIAHLFPEVPVGTRVRVINEEVAAAWVKNRLYVAVFPNKSQVDEIDIEHPITRVVPDDLVQRVRTVAGERGDEVDWALVTRLGLERNGIPTPVTPPSVADATPVATPVSAQQPMTMPPAR